MEALCFEDVTKTYADRHRQVRALSHLSFHVDDGEFVVLVGPSGCGKSTTLRVAAGLERPDHGRILIHGADVTTMPPKERNLAMVFQDHALYHHLTVDKNLSFGLRMRGLAGPLIRQKIEEASHFLELDQLLNQKPGQLSGGERQRVALGRALVRNPNAFLFDEPLTNLDLTLRSKVRRVVKRIHRGQDAAMLYVTHDQEEAMTMADRVVLLRHGAVQQDGPPLDLYERPVNRFVAAFFGSPPMNFLDGHLERDGHEISFVCSFGRIPFPREFASGISANGRLDVTALGIRPEHVRIGVGEVGTETSSIRPSRDAYVAISRLSISEVEHTGVSTRVSMSGPQGGQLVAVVSRTSQIAIAQMVPVSLDVSRILLFAGDDGVRVSGV